MKGTFNQSTMDELVAQTIEKKNIRSVVLCVEKGNHSFSHVSSAGNMEDDTPYFLASVTKLYITAIILKLRMENRVDLDDKISQYLPEDTVSRIHILKDIDYSNEITIKHLMSNTSGIPDYFTSDVFLELVDGKDQLWPFEKTVQSVKKMKPKFKPGQKGKVHYSDTNYQLLGEIIKTITGQSIHEVFRQYIFDALNLQHSYVYEDVNDEKPLPLTYKSKQLLIPQYMSSIPAEGGIVSTAQESMIFLKAFINGQLFPKNDLNELMSNWNFLLLPGQFYYGVGIVKQPISLVSFKNGLIGHWGQSGAFAFYYPQKDLYFTGTVNQIIGHSVAARLISKIIKRF
ncbi:serine hydrolase domain-containing protein [Lysinibacillus sp. fls2-241-R2A-57]|uniref:serine hydrolase domain-containing protein n=2 Tax=unclassified Lysinibacillus TaxID=2636778 RepID=UPI0025551445|nr:serine hydrolase domain-containing protein [Lysinibacillus sp. fls2-241-R2A-57]